MEVFCSEVMKNQVAFYLVTEPRYFSEHKEAVAGRCSLQKVFLEISQNSEENTSKFLRKFFVHRTPPVAASEHITGPKSDCWFYE